jgi:acid phosphatase family membrane protein YuiD
LRKTTIAMITKVKGRNIGMSVGIATMIEIIVRQDGTKVRRRAGVIAIFRRDRQRSTDAMTATVTTTALAG